MNVKRLLSCSVLSLPLSPDIVNTFAIVLKLPRAMNVCTTMRAVICLVAFVISIICDDRRTSENPCLYITHSSWVTRVRRSFLEDLELRSGLSILFYTYVPQRAAPLFRSPPPSTAVGKVRWHKTALLPSCKARLFDNPTSAYTRRSIDVSSCNLPRRSDLPTRSRDRFNRDEYETITLQKLITDMENPIRRYRRFRAIIASTLNASS